MKLKPAAAGTGIRFVRVDIGPDAVVEALATNVSSTARSTTLSQGEASIQTIEHLLRHPQAYWGRKDNKK